MQLFESLRNQDTKKLEEKAKALAEREAAQNLKEQETLAALVRVTPLNLGHQLRETRLGAIQHYQLPYLPFDL